MKIAHQIICDRIEEILTKKLEKETGKEYIIFFPFDKQIVKRLDEGTFSLECIEIIEVGDEEDKKYSSKLNRVEFFQLTRKIEEKRTIQEIYNKMKKVILKNRPELYEKELEYSASIEGEYIIVLVVVALLISLLFPEIRGWFYQLFEQLINCKI